MYVYKYIYVSVCIRIHSHTWAYTFKCRFSTGYSRIKYSDVIRNMHSLNLICLNVHQWYNSNINFSRISFSYVSFARLSNNALNYFCSLILWWQHTKKLLGFFCVYFYISIPAGFLFSSRFLPCGRPVHIFPMKLKLSAWTSSWYVLFH